VALRLKVSLSLVAACSLAVVMPRVAAAQHITIDGRFSPAQTLVGPNYSIGANLGKQVGGNLFHSFGQFSLATPESATFSGPATIGNVISRVTGGNGSKIDGKIQSNITGANLYLINPNGVLFGPNATVNVSGSFHASTADYLKMSDGQKFQATNPDGSTLSAAPPAAFGFLTPTPRPIGVNGSKLGPVPGTLGLVAGPLAIIGGTLTAPAGTIHVTSVASTGEVPVDPRNAPALTVTRFGPVDLKTGSKLDVSNPSGLGSGGSVFIRSGALTIDAGEINADNYSSGASGQLVLRGDKISLSSSSISSDTYGSANAGTVIVSAGSLSIASNSNLSSDTHGPGSGGATIITAGSLSITSGGQVSSSTFASGGAGSVTISVPGQLTIDGSGASPQGRVTGIFSQANPTSSGAAGSANVSAGTLSIANNGKIQVSTPSPPAMPEASRLRLPIS
jgi:filamentous hemagglutinin family protein